MTRRYSTGHTTNDDIRHRAEVKKAAWVRHKNAVRILPNMTTNGILPRIPGQYVAEAINQLPPAASTRDTLLRTELDVPGVGRVLFTPVRNATKHRKTTHWIWSVTSAELVS